MLTRKPTKQMIARWKKLFEENRTALTPNRKTGEEVDAYFRARYPYNAFNDAAFRAVVEANIMENGFSRKKLPAGEQPKVRCYQTGGVTLGIDTVSGEFHAESEDVAEVAAVYDDLFAFRGLDAEDIKNFFLVAQYVELTRK